MSGSLTGLGGGGFSEDPLQLKIDTKRVELKSKSEQNDIEMAELLDDAERLAVGVHGRQIFHNPAPPPGVVEKLAKEKLKSDRTKVATVSDGRLSAQQHGRHGKRAPVKRRARVLLGDAPKQTVLHRTHCQGPGAVVIS